MRQALTEELEKLSLMRALIKSKPRKRRKTLVSPRNLFDKDNGGEKVPQVEAHFNVDEKLWKRFERALRKSGFTTKSEFFRSKIRELVAETEGRRS